MKELLECIRIRLEVLHDQQELGVGTGEEARQSNINDLEYILEELEKKVASNKALAKGPMHKLNLIGDLEYILGMLKEN